MVVFRGNLFFCRLPGGLEVTVKAGAQNDQCWKHQHCHGSMSVSCTRLYKSSVSTGLTCDADCPFAVGFQLTLLYGPMITLSFCFDRSVRDFQDVVNRTRWRSCCFTGDSEVCACLRVFVRMCIPFASSLCSFSFRYRWSAFQFFSLSCSCSFSVGFSHERAVV